jgi:hypothetical protein
MFFILEILQAINVTANVWYCLGGILPLILVEVKVEKSGVAAWLRLKV